MLDNLVDDLFEAQIGMNSDLHGDEEEGELCMQCNPWWVVSHAF